LAETSFAGAFGIDADLAAVPREGVSRNDELLFSESQSRFVVTVRPEVAASFEEVMAGRPWARVGEVTESPTLRLRGLEGREVVWAEIGALKAAWQKPLREI
jgi:phosphoribosylformylglycinamidine synthase